MNSARNQTTMPSETGKHPLHRAYVIGSIIVGIAIAAHISNALGATVLAAVLAIFVLLALTASLLWFLIRKAMSDASGSDAIKSGNNPRSQAVWKTLWLVPILLFIAGFAADLIGFKEPGKWVGVAGVLTILPIVPTYVVMGIRRSVRQRRAA